MEVSTSIRFSFVTTINITIPKFTKTRYQTTKIRCMLFLLIEYIYIYIYACVAFVI
ncbi:hypothetical protein ACJIZ3_008677 [Penstemon smallii]|uniref:Uncharacterized protein n=1 Tax=Penstemon smallii TaxID=265156 RepID=A0ABD3TBF7_9LAMI